MVKTDSLIFGYRKLKISPEDLSKVTSILLRASVQSRINPDGTLTVRERDFEKLRGLFSGRIEFEYSKPLGLLGKYRLLPHKKAYFFAIIISLIALLFLSNLVWDIRIEGNENIPDSEIRLGLENCGLSIGDFWANVERGKIEAAYLADESRISWININRRGSVAYVKVMEKDVNEQKKEEKYLYSNIVSTVDCVIEEITVKRGTSVVKVGDVVKKGDVLIVGVIPEESGGGFCSAEGSVVGRINEILSVQLDRKYEKITTKNKKVYSIDLNFFNFSLNIFKRYGNLTNKCDIIDTEKTYSLFGVCRLPFSISIKYVPEYQICETEYTDEELVSVASQRLEALIATKLCVSDLLKIKSYGRFTPNGYEISSDVVYLSEVSNYVELKAQ